MVEVDVPRLRLSMDAVTALRSHTFPLTWDDPHFHCIAALWWVGGSEWGKQAVGGLAWVSGWVQVHGWLGVRGLVGGRVWVHGLLGVTGWDGQWV